MMCGYILPEDVMVCIMWRIPVRSLLRFKCVCKSWYSLIKSPVFISEHLQHQHSLNELANAPLFIVDDDLLNDYRVSWTTPSKNNNDTVVPSIHLDDSRRTVRTVLGPVNAIYCTIEVINREWSMVLYNPALRESKSIEDLTYTRIFKDANRYFKHSYGFGYASGTNDFKVVHVSLLVEDFVSPVMPSMPVFVFVYTLSSNSWRKINTYNDDFGFLYDSSVYVRYGGGSINWSGTDDDGSITLSFDLGTEKFTKQKLPYRGINDYRKSNTNMSYFRDSIGVLLNLHGSVYQDIRYDISIMKEYGVEDSWAKLHNIHSFPPGVDEQITLYKISKSDKIIFDRYTKTSQLKWCGRGSCQDIEQPGILINVVSYMESLISIS